MLQSARTIRHSVFKIYCPVIPVLLIFRNPDNLNIMKKQIAFEGGGLKKALASPVGTSKEKRIIQKPKR